MCSERKKAEKDKSGHRLVVAKIQSVDLKKVRSGHFWWNNPLVVWHGLEQLWSSGRKQKDHQRLQRTISLKAGFIEKMLRQFANN